MLFFLWNTEIPYWRTVQLAGFSLCLNYTLCAVKDRDASAKSSVYSQPLLKKPKSQNNPCTPLRHWTRVWHYWWASYSTTLCVGHVVTKSLRLPSHPQALFVFGEFPNCSYLEWLGNLGTFSYCCFSLGFFSLLMDLCANKKYPIAMSLLELLLKDGRKWAVSPKDGDHWEDSTWA